MALLYYRYLIQCNSKFPSNLVMLIWWSKMFFSKLCCWIDFSKPSCEAWGQHSRGNESKTFYSSWNSMFWTQSFLFNSYVYYITLSFIPSTGAFNVLTCAFNLPTFDFSLLTREFELVTRGCELLIRGFELVTRNSCFNFPQFYFDHITVLYLLLFLNLVSSICFRTAARLLRKTYYTKERK